MCPVLDGMSLKLWREQMMETAASGKMLGRLNWKNEMIKNNGTALVGTCPEGSTEP